MSSLLHRFFGFRNYRKIFVDKPNMKLFSEHIRVYKSEACLSEKPQQLWSTSRNGGLESFLLDYEGLTLPFTEVTIFLSCEAAMQIANFQSWTQQTISMLSQSLLAFQQKHNLQERFSDHPLGVQFWIDGQHALHLQLDDSEFAIGLLPNQYKRHSHSQPLVRMLAYIPRKWDKYQHIGSLYNDQCMFTIGTSSLDNFSHNTFLCPSLYRLFIDETGMIHHELNPALEPELQLEMVQKANRPDSIVISHQGKTVVSLVLELIETNRRTDPLQDSIDVHTQSISRTSRQLDLTHTGYLLQKVHFSKWISGYRLYLCRDGTVRSQAEKSVGEIKVIDQNIFFIPRRTPSFLGNKLVRSGKTYPLTGKVTLNCSGTMFGFSDLRNSDIHKWPYIGSLTYQAQTTHHNYGVELRIGRQSDLEIQLQDSQHNQNIIWRPEVTEGDTLPSKRGSIPKANFSTDAIMVAGTHAKIDIKADPILVNLASGCFSFIRRNGDLIRLLPKDQGGGTEALQDGDEIMIGNSLFQLHLSHPPIWSTAEQLLDKSNLFPFPATEDT